MSDNKPKKDTWSLIKETAETQEERSRHADMELNTLKNEQVLYDKTLKAFVDGYGNKYSGNQVNEKNQLVRSKAIVIINENKIKDPHYVNKFMFSTNRKWKQPEDNIGEKDWATPQLPEEKTIKKIEIKKIYTIQPELKLPMPEDTPIIEKITKPEMSIQEIINQRIAIKNQTGGINALKNKNFIRDDGLENENFLNGHGLYKPKDDI